MNVLTDKDIDKICDKIIEGEYILVPSRACGKSYLRMRIMIRLFERGYKVGIIPHITKS